MPSDWYFPNTVGGTGRGYAEAGLATFGGKIIPSLVREVCQNSLDAADASGKPVRVEFERYTIQPEEIPGFDQIRRAVGRAFVYWSSERSEDTNAHLQRVRKILGAKEVSVLRMSDFGTTGLGQAYKDKLGDWNKLIKIDGAATKGGESAGSYGIGKNAPFTASDLRLVFYRTFTREKENGGRATQGIMRLPASPTNITRELSTMRSGTGYYCDSAQPDRLLPVPCVPALDSLCKRTQVGTDVFVYGFTGQKSWMDDVGSEILESFLLAIHEKRLEVVLQEKDETRIFTCATLEDNIKCYRSRAKNAAAYYQILARAEDVEEIKHDFHGLGELKLRIFTDPEKELNRKVLVIRSNRMKIFHIDRISRNLPFTGIVELEGRELNRFFRAMETPAHDAWDPERYRADPKQAKKYKKEFQDWVKDEVLKIARFSTSDQTNVAGLGRDLQKKAKQSPQQNLDGTVSSQGDVHEKAGTSPVHVSVRASQQSSENISADKSDGQKESSSGANDAVGGSSGDGAPAKGHAKSSGRRADGPRRKKKSTSGGKMAKAIDMQSVRLLRTGSGKYRIRLKVAEPVRSGRLSLAVIGEDGTRYKSVHVRSARVVGRKDVKVAAAGNEIWIRDFPENDPVSIDIVTSDDRDYAMAVTVEKDLGD